ncbi:MAG TPA: UrcA family protein [Steroidobacteraceae bacterium]|nr:UrcA family protein [Steroidobacteraceae bacterium]
MTRIEARTWPNARPWIIGLGALCFAVTALEAPANPADGEPRSVTVGFADLNLNSPEGAQALYRRISSAARTVCGLNSNPLPAVRIAARQCYQEAIAGAVAKVDSQTLTALHRAKWKDSRVG